MKKNILSLLITILLGACTNNSSISDDESFTLKIVSPTGAPSLAFYNEMDNNNFETNSKASNIISTYMANASADIVVVDSVSGIKTINANNNYQIAANITFGNFYLASTGNDDNDSLDKDDNILIFNSIGATPDVIFKYIYGDDFTNLFYGASGVSEASKCLATGKTLDNEVTLDYVFIAEPVLSSVLSNTSALTYGKAKIYANIQDEYKKKSAGKELIQASIFVKKSDNESYNKTIKNYLNELKNSINIAINEPIVLYDTLGMNDDETIKLKYGISKEIAKSCLDNNNSLGLGYKDAFSNKENIDAFINLFGMENTCEEIYFK